MSFSIEKFIGPYVLETTEHLEKITAIFAKSSIDKEDLQTLLRIVHTIKGSSRMLAFTSIEKLSHAIEDIFKSIDNGKINFSENNRLLFKIATNKIKTALSNLQKNKSDDIENLDIILEKCKIACTEEVFDLSEINDIKNESNYTNIDDINYVNLNIEEINTILFNLNTIITNQFKIKNQLEKSNILHGDEVLSTQIYENFYIAENEIFNLQQKVLNLRMIPLSIILNPLKLEIENDARKISKDVELELPKKSVKIDKIILKHLQDILIQLVRNALVHGIEKEEDRKNLNKTEKAKISINVFQLSNRILITIEDNGKGLDTEKIREKAIQLLPEQKNKILKMNENEIQNFIFYPGLSTQTEVTELSGRGIGLDIVKNNIEKIKGNIRVYSKQNEGTKFELNIPFSLSSQHGIFVKVSSYSFFIPSHYIIKMINAYEMRIIKGQEQDYIIHDNKKYPFFHLSKLLNIKTHKDSITILIVEHLSTSIALGIESIEQYENILVQALPKSLQSFKGFQGLVFNNKYVLIPILDIPWVIQKMNSIHSYDIKKYQALNEKKSKRILIVDDSNQILQIEKSIFENANFIVYSARDGIEAINILQEKHIDIIITDINMPKMKGNILIKNIRRNSNYNGIPIIVLTGFYTEKDSNELLSLGAQKIIFKSQFNRDNLLKITMELLNEKN